MPTPKPTPRPRPRSGHVRIGRTLVHVSIDWEEYDKELARTGKSPKVFTVHGYNKSWRVNRDRIKFEAGKPYKEKNA